MLPKLAESSCPQKRVIFLKNALLLPFLQNFMIHFCKRALSCSNSTICSMAVTILSTLVAFPEKKVCFETIRGKKQNLSYIIFIEFSYRTRTLNKELE